jgi:adenylate kinase
VFHLTALPSKVEGICDHCGEKLIQREDDRAEAVRVRMQAYEQSTKPLIDYFGARGLLVTIPADGKPEEIYRRTITALTAKG